MSAAPGFVKYPNYEMKIVRADCRVRVLTGHTVVADSTDAVLVLETKHRPVYYLPWVDVVASLLTKTDASTYCPFKGHASYWSVNAGDRTVDGVAWGYEDPYDECQPLRGYAAFSTDKVDVEVDGEVIDREGPGWVR